MLQSRSMLLVLMGLFCCVAICVADTLPPDVVVRQGAIDVRLSEVDAFAERLPASDRGGYFDNARRLDSTLRSLLLNGHFAAEARKTGLDKDPEVQAQIELAVRETLVRVSLDRFRRELKVPDFTDLAKEKYLANKAQYVLPMRLDVRHILISIENRDGPSAKALAEEVRNKALAGTESFEDLVKKYSEDPSKEKNEGLMQDASSDRYVSQFSEAAKKLQKVGDISPIVKTRFGYHVLELVNRVDGRQLTFDEAKGELISTMRDAYLQEQVEIYVAGVQKGEIVSNPDLVASLRTRYAESEDSSRGSMDEAKSSSSRPDSAKNNTER